MFRGLCFSHCVIFNKLVLKMQVILSWAMLSKSSRRTILNKQSPENIQFFLGTTRTFQNLPTFLVIDCMLFYLFYSERAYCFNTSFFGIHFIKSIGNHPECTISLVKYQIFILFMKIFLGTRFLGSSKKLSILSEPNVM